MTSSTALPALTISIGEPDGSVMSCGLTQFCELVVLPTITDLETHLWHPHRQPGRCGNPDSPIDIELGGTAARADFFPDMSQRGCVSFFPPSERVHIYAVHDGRPLIISFHKGTFADLGSKGEAIIDSFRFLP